MQFRGWQQLDFDATLLVNKQTNKQVNKVKEKMLENSVLSGGRTGQ